MPLDPPPLSEIVHTTTSRFADNREATVCLDTVGIGLNFCHRQAWKLRLFDYWAAGRDHDAQLRGARTLYSSSSTYAYVRPGHYQFHSQTLVVVLAA
ncbi:hypothetical protein TgHK011_008026 [Trichoderma gracile]|nr:hypothetical protein TgHK011_008026 [Trichoderma gracile]